MNMQLIEPPTGLEQRILAQIRWLIRVRLFGFSVLTATSFGGIIGAAVYLIGAFGQSGFHQYLSLAFSDQTVLLTYGKELGLSLIESLPVFGLAAFLAVVAVFIWSLTKITNNNRYAYQWTS